MSARLKMGKMRCPSCRAYVSSEAKACRHCGHHFSTEQLEEQRAFEVRNRRLQPVAGLVMLALLLGVATCAYKAATTPPTPAAALRTAEFWARGTAAAAVKQRMKNPASFDLVDAQAVPIKLEDGSAGWAVGVTYRGTNSFGGVTRQDALVSVDASGKAPLQVIDLQRGKRRR